MPKAAEIANFINKPLIGQNIEVRAPSHLGTLFSGALLFLKTYKDEYLQKLDGVSDVLVIACPEYSGCLKAPHIISDSPRLNFARILQRYFDKRPSPGIDKTAIVHPSAEIGQDVYIGKYTTIGADVKIGDATEIRDKVTIFDHTQIGKNCLIRSNTVLGEEGFGFEFEDGIPLRIPHLGRLVIGDNVEIGSLNAIARGTLADTIIGNNVKTDDLVFIAHNVQIGDNTVIIAGAQVSGSVKVGKNVWISPRSVLIQQISIGDNAMIGLGAVVLKSVEPGVVVAGNPARVIGLRNDES